MTRADQKLPTSVKVTRHPGLRGTAVAVLTPQQPERDMLAFMGFNGWLSGFELQRFSLLAALWRVRIVIPEVPGCSTRPSRVSARQGFDLLRGSFHSLASEMVSASRPHIPTPDAVLGYSMGASLACAALAVTDPARLPARAVVLVEPVAIRRWTPRALIRATRAEDEVAYRYVHNTLAWDGAVQPPEDAGPDAEPYHPGRISMTLTGNAMRANRLGRDLERGLRARPECQTVIVHGLESQLSKPEDVAKLIRAVRAIPADVIDVPVPGSHPLWHSLDSVSELAAGVESAWA